ncbi:unnamed protein product, partial [Oppiella nova]
MLGYVISGLVFSHYSDKYGRRPIVWLGFTIELTGILLCAVSPNIYFYSIARFLVGMGSSGREMAIYIMCKFGVNSAWNVISVHGSELYPTVLRVRGLGVASVIGRIGSISAPFMKNLAATTGLSLVMTLYGTLTCVGAVLGLFLPETKGREIPDTIEEAEN